MTSRSRPRMVHQTDGARRKLFAVCAAEVGRGRSPWREKCRRLSSWPIRVRWARRLSCFLPGLDRLSLSFQPGGLPSPPSTRSRDTSMQSHRLASTRRRGLDALCDLSCTSLAQPVPAALPIIWTWISAGSNGAGRWHSSVSAVDSSPHPASTPK